MNTRPVSVTIICIIGFFGAIVAIPLVFLPTTAAIGAWYPPYLGFSCVLGLCCMVGLWKMKKWAAYLYTAFVLVNQVVLLTMGVWNFLAIIA